MQFVNLTPHAITVLAPDGAVALTLAPSGAVARVAMARTSEAQEGLGFEFHRSVSGPVEGLPAPAPGVGFVVSALVRTHPALAGRNDVFSPGPLARDEKGQPVGCSGLEQN